MKKEYVVCEIEVIRLDFCDVITTSGEGSGGTDIVPEDPFEGGYDLDGWT